MDVIESILSRRSCRTYTDQPIPEETIQELLVLGTKAATGSGMQPWGFVTLKNKEEIAALSTEIKDWLKTRLFEEPWLAQYEEWINNAKYNIFYDAHNVIAVYGDVSSHWYVYDCTLCTANIMLAAQDKGIGSCWIGFAESFMNRLEIKARYHVPSNYNIVSVMSLGFARGSRQEAKRQAPVIFNK